MRYTSTIILFCLLIALSCFSCATIYIGDESTPKEDRVTLRVDRTVDLWGFDLTQLVFAMHGELSFEPGIHVLFVKFSDTNVYGTRRETGLNIMRFDFKKGIRYQIVAHDYGMSVAFEISMLPQ